MNKLVIVALILLSAATSFAQNFEGEITYVNTYKSKTPQLTDLQWQKMMGQNQTYLIKGGDYKTVSDGEILQWQLYVNAENKLYSKMSNSPAILWNDGLKNVDSIISVKVNRNVDSVLTYLCDELVMTCKSGVNKYYFNSALKVDVALYKNHLMGNWYEVLKLTQAIPLKMTIHTTNFSIESVATKVKATEIKATDLVMPTNVKLIKNPYE